MPGIPGSRAGGRLPPTDLELDRLMRTRKSRKQVEADEAAARAKALMAAHYEQQRLKEAAEAAAAAEQARLDAETERLAKLQERKQEKESRLQRLVDGKSRKQAAAEERQKVRVEEDLQRHREIEEEKIAAKMRCSTKYCRS